MENGHSDIASDNNPTIITATENSNYEEDTEVNLKTGSETDNKKDIKKVIDEVIKEILSDSKPGEKTKGQSTQYEKHGGWPEAKKDFYKLNPLNIRDFSKIEIIEGPDGSLVQAIIGKLIGTLPDGRQVNVRVESSDQRPTLEIQDGRKKNKD